MIFKVKNNQFVNNEVFKRNSKNCEVLGKTDEYTLLKVHKNKYFELSYNLGGDTISNNSFEVIDYELGDDTIHKMGVGEVHKPFWGVRMDNDITKNIDSFRDYLEKNDIKIKYINYDKHTVSFNKIDVKIIIDYLEDSNTYWRGIQKYYDSIVVNLY